MSITIDLNVETDLTESQRAALVWIERCLAAGAEIEQLPSAEVSVTLLDNEAIRRLNHEYRDVDRPTDVLSFPLWEPDEEWETTDGEPVPLGDIFISIPRAVEQAAEYGHSFERELGFLAVHGFLHLLGYDHGTEAEEKEMFTRQEEILERVGLKR
ncbi:rRNA maturation RNase YbeY [Polycladomyces sp. WAk]|uniref:Endoribonuclease YbeY n=1 Tax=Polycladomyces zharkentensis TaxID=2807616 RepID=A0ABS2WG99_9BACL|nr:rRNA maturation RNase YbeY [Polycladomyces sp. WAk]MBN2908536.1 rRNA maturation RNase YbeY [Polycladomyces sp. WAk]